MQIIPLSEGSFTIDKTKVFVPFDTEKEELNNRPIGSLLVEIQPFLVITEKDVILLDTGLGYNEADGTPQLYKNLQRAGINPAQVTKVLMSHLHKDHAGGVTIDNVQTQERFISFPYATYYVQQREMEFALGIGSASYIPEDFRLLEEFSRVVWLTEEEGVIDGYIRYQLTGAHSKYHQVFWIEENGQTAFFGGDDAPQLQQMKSRFVAKYDYDGKKCMELRKQWWEEGQQKGWTFLFYHDIQSPVWGPLKS
ncbi:MBL fold metallo-hydrolase [Sediminibacterium goheungense]|uniref:Glyoxylase-like metal-dependent hydrolase (Beta-lactamase superfamily II) n=1 Tax=Sediminibacterium goheungense TaxID=1086393 RepID=A0A4R6J140_9BACT|nr:MBL fold metallo-hydrolase [Sediminibacterium goheungense]TDO28940.1 glyoxylase-like metal-dependent hydrolase (beta-lactamase superfamily II) [Sediminibacterium goheungense]